MITEGSAVRECISADFAHEFTVHLHLVRSIVVLAVESALVALRTGKLLLHVHRRDMTPERAPVRVPLFAHDTRDAQVLAVPLVEKQRRRRFKRLSAARLRAGKGSTAQRRILYSHDRVWCILKVQRTQPGLRKVKTSFSKFLGASALSIQLNIHCSGLPLFCWTSSDQDGIP